MSKDPSFHNRKYEFGIVGLGNIGEVLSRHLLGRFPNSYINISSRRSPDNIRLDLSDTLIKIPTGDKDPVSSHDLTERVRIFNEIDGKMKVGETKKEFLDSDIIVYCARNRKKPFSSFKNRDDEFNANKPLLDQDFPRLEGYKGIVLVVTGPIEPTAEYLARKSRIPRERIAAMSYIETQRFREALRREIEERGYEISKDEIKKAVVIGEHGSTRVPIYSLVTVSGKDFLEIEELNSSSLRGRVNRELEDQPNKLQISKDTGGNVRKPAYAAIKSIEYILSGREIPLGSFEFFITNMVKFNAEKKPSGEVYGAKANPDFLDKISKKERKRFDQSKEELKRRFKRLGLI